MAQIEPAFTPLISVCRELPTAAGFVDNLWITPEGGIVLGECKRFRNQQARREVIVQALDYARALATMSYDDLQNAVRKALKAPSATLHGLAGDQCELSEVEFVDGVERRLRQSRFMVLVIGDGIQEGVEALSGYLQLHAGLHVGLAMVDLSTWRDAEGGLLIVPRIPMRTVLIERGIVVIDQSGAPHIHAPAESAKLAGQARPYSASEPEFYQQLEQRRPGLGALLRSFLARIADLGVIPEYRKSLIPRWDASADVNASPGYIDAYGKLWPSTGWNAANQLGNPAAGDRYLAALAAIVGPRPRCASDSSRRRSRAFALARRHVENRPHPDDQRRQEPDQIFLAPIGARRPCRTPSARRETDQ
jgi:hypothetical protein